MEYFYLILGFVVLIYSGDFLVRGGVSLARHFNVSTLVIGVTIVSLGTSLPELFVSLQAAIEGHPDMAIGNVVGSNIANIALVLALTSIIFPLGVKRTTIRFDTPFMLAASGLFYLFILNYSIQFFEGILFVVLLAGFVYWSFRKAVINRDLNTLKVEPKYSFWVSILIILISSVGLRFGATWLVRGAASVARDLNISETIISVSLIAFGTSVPELVTSIIAAVKKEPDISVGNIIGSNIFNLFGVLGITSLFGDIQVSQSILDFHIFWMFGIAILLFVLILPVFKSYMFRWKGVVLFILYILYIWFMFKHP